MLTGEASNGPVMRYFAVLAGLREIYLIQIIGNRHRPVEPFLY